MAGRVALFFPVTGVIGYYLFPWLGRRAKRIKAAELEVSGLLTAALAFPVLATALGLHFILGAFLAGLFFVRRPSLLALSRADRLTGGLRPGVSSAP